MCPIKTLLLNAEGATDRDTIIFALGAAAASETAVGFVYRDQDGVISLRLAQPQGVGRVTNGKDKGALYFRAFDIHRNAPRCFRVDNVLSLV